MDDNAVREDLAFIRAAIEEGRSYATGRSPDMVVWGIAIAIGYLGTYGFVRGWSDFKPDWLWTACIALPWLYSLRRPLRRLVGNEAAGQTRPMVLALRMMWFGCGVFLTSLWLATMWTGDIRQGWFPAVVAGIFGAAMFATAFLANLRWLRWVAVLWWAGELAVYALRQQPEALLLSAVLMLALLAGPGLFLLQRRRPGAV